MGIAIPRELLKVFRKLYPGHTTSASLPSRKAERSLFERMEMQREELRAMLFGSDYVLERFLLTIRQVLQKEIRFSTVFLATKELNSYRLKDTEKVTQLLTDLSTAEKYLAVISARKDRLSQTSFNSGDRLQITRGVATARNKALIIMRNWRLRNTWIEREINELEHILAALNDFKVDQMASTDEQWEQMSTYRTLLASIAETPEELENRIHALKSTFSEFIRIRNQLVESKLFLVLAELKYFPGDHRDYSDMLQMGCVALIDAVEAFDRSRRIPLDTFIVRGIYRKLQREYPAFQKMIRIPAHRDSAVRIIDTIMQNTINLRDNQAFFEDICLNVSKSEKEIDTLLRAMFPILDLEYPVDTIILGSKSLGRMKRLPLKDTVIFEDKTFQEICRKELHQALLSLSREWTAREYQIITQKYGINNRNSEHSSQEVADSLKLAQERIRQIEGKMMHRLQSPSVSSRLVGFLD